MKIILITGTEGGIGKTSTAFFLTSILLQRGNVAVIDANTINHDSYKIYKMDDFSFNNIAATVNQNLLYQTRYAASYFRSEFIRSFSGQMPGICFPPDTTCSALEIIMRKAHNLSLSPSEDALFAIFSNGLQAFINNLVANYRDRLIHLGYFSNRLTIFRTSQPFQLFANDLINWPALLLESQWFHEQVAPDYVIIDTNYSPGNIKQPYFPNAGRHPRYAFTIMDCSFFDKQNNPEKKVAFNNTSTYLETQGVYNVFLFSTYTNYAALNYLKAGLDKVTARLIKEMAAWKKSFDTIRTECQACVSSASQSDPPGCTVEPLSLTTGDITWTAVTRGILENYINCEIHRFFRDNYDIFTFARAMYNFKCPGTVNQLLVKLWEFLQGFADHSQNWNNLKKPEPGIITAAEMGNLPYYDNKLLDLFVTASLDELKFFIFRKNELENFAANYKNVYIGNYLNLLQQKIAHSIGTGSTGTTPDTVGDLYYTINNKYPDVLKKFNDYLMTIDLF